MGEAKIKATAAVQFEPGAPLSLRDVTLDAPGVGEVLVKTKATGICHTDYSTPGVLTALPVIPGHEGAGIVEALGEGVTGLEIGDHVPQLLVGASKERLGRHVPPKQTAQSGWCVDVRYGGRAQLPLFFRFVPAETT